MGKERYIKQLENRYPGETKEILELAWHFHSMEKAKYYEEVLAQCNSNADIAFVAVRQMYVSGDIDRVKATSEKFIALLLPFTSKERMGKPHSVVYHIRKMLAEKEVHVERKVMQEKKRDGHLSYDIHPEEKQPTVIYLNFFFPVECLPVEISLQV